MSKNYKETKMARKRWSLDVIPGPD